MTYIERLKIESEKSNDSIILWKDGGLFLMAMEQSAYLFNKLVKPSKTLIKTLKDKEPFIHIGVKKDCLANYLKDAKIDFAIDEDSEKITISLLADTSTDGFISWRNEQIKQLSDDKSNEKDNSTTSSKEKVVLDKEKIEKLLDTTHKINEILDEVLSLNIADITAMEALNFLNTLKKKLRRIEREC